MSIEKFPIFSLIMAKIMQFYSYNQPNILYCLILLKFDDFGFSYFCGICSAIFFF